MKVETLLVVREGRSKLFLRPLGLCRLLLEPRRKYMECICVPDWAAAMAQPRRRTSTLIGVSSNP